ncbi:MAG: molybdopterin-dependent oxidoreductase [Anaerosomatales bacterium]|nr:molybdopterin-dependent oxidoreductase [Anaerosomatales bacterium]MDT8434091.1 molybdopterin-dependent oxidoreductase [Anaerosomatales bacterium]
MTNNWADLGNGTLFVVMGSNFVENHPAATAHALKAVDERGAKIIVIDPRKTRTAILAEAHGGRYIRQRPGTDIAFNMGLTRKIIRMMEGLEGDVDQEVKDNFFTFLNQSESQTFYNNDGTTRSRDLGSRYTDARFRVNAAGTDYVRETGTGDTDMLYFPEKAASVNEPDTVYSRLKEHVEPYTPAVVADICGVTEEELDFVARAFIDNSRHMSSKLTGDSVIGLQDPRDKGNYRATTMMYAMGLTQHTCGSQNVKSFTVLQILMGNMGRAGGGINALRGIHNVQGSTDMGLLYHLIPGYSGNPRETRVQNSEAFGMYTDKLWGQPTRYGELPYDDAYGVSGGLQARGFYNMTLKWFGDYDLIHGMPYGTRAEKDAKRAAVDAIYDLWPKTNGDDHILMFRKAVAGHITAMMVWGQNPAVTEPNQSMVRDGLENLDTLVVVDMFENETAACKRKEGSVTYLIPASSYAEEAGSVANSGRVLQWRERACAPKGNTKSDLELLLRFTYALEGAGAFSHIAAKWQAAPLSWTLSGMHPVYDKLYKEQYGWSPADATGFEDLTENLEMWYADSRGFQASAPVVGSEVVAEKIYQQCNIRPANGGTMWLYLDGYQEDYTSRKHGAAPGGAAQDDWKVFNRSKNRDSSDPNGTLAYPGWGFSWLVNRRVLYNNGDVPGDNGDGYQGPDKAARLFVCKQPNTIGYANNNWRLVHGLSDRPDVIVAADASSAEHSVYSGRFPAHVEPYETPREDLAEKWGRNTKGTAKWDLIHGQATKVATNDASYNAVNRVSADSFPFVLTTIRCVEHFQGGPITRNNPWNVEAEPTPWIEINSVDAAAKGITTGDMVDVITARSNSTSDQEGRTVGAPFAEGFIARVGVGAEDNQRVGVGVVAIPWHWGDRGLSTGSRANDLCIDSMDANTTIPEYKACLCDIRKVEM